MQQISRHSVWLIAALCSNALVRPAAADTALTTVRVTDDVVFPLFVASPPGDFARLFIVEKVGRIKIFSGGAVFTTPYINIIPLVNSNGSEQGLLGLAFHPNYASNGFFYVNYTDYPGHTVIARYTVQGDPATSNVANPGSRTVIKFITQTESNHNGGCLQFGPDGMLYCGMGDGGGFNDLHGPIGHGQALNTLLGKMIRLDVDNPPSYVPANNPFVGPGDPLDEIWAIGFRNPWRFSFDRRTGDIYIADVGQAGREEIDFQPAASTGGENYGWRCMEGTLCTGFTGCTCNSPSLTLPIYEYPHTLGRCSVTGGYVYRGPAIPDLQETYFFADYCTGQIWSFRYNGAVTEFTERTIELAPDVGAILNIVSFGEDAAGELYICDPSSGVFKIVPDIIDCNQNSTADAEDIANGTSQDCNSNGVPDECDIAQGTSSDCNADGIPEECQSGGQGNAALILAVCTQRTHAGSPCCLPVTGVIPAESSEPRSGGIRELQITFDRDLCASAFTLNGAAVSIEQTTTGLYPAFEPYPGPTGITTGGAGSLLVLNFSPELADARAYRITFSSAVTTATGERFDIRALTGDVNSSGSTDAGDRSVLVGVWTGSGFSCPTDMNLTGITNATDRSIIVGVWTSGANTAP